MELFNLEITRREKILNDKAEQLAKWEQEMADKVKECRKIEGLINLASVCHVKNYVFFENFGKTRNNNLKKLEKSFIDFKSKDSIEISGSKAFI